MTSGEIAVLANPAAGRGRHRGLLPGVVERLGAAGHVVRLLEASTAAEAEKACRRAVDEGAKALVAVGGDGTVHQALQAVASSGPVPAAGFGPIAAGSGPVSAGFGPVSAGSGPVSDGSGPVPAGFGPAPAGSGLGAAGPGAAAAGFGPVSAGSGAVSAGCGMVSVGFGVVPAGTGNDFAAGVGVPSDPLAAASAIADALREGRSRPIDLARTTGTDGETRWFGAVLAAGFDAVVNERANRMRWPRGPRRYDLAIVLEMARVRPRLYALEIDGVSHDFEGTLVAVGICPSYGGGLRILPAADPTDGLLDVVTAEPLSRVALARLKPRLRAGTHVTDPRVHTFRGRQVRLHTDGIIAYADGERIGPLPQEITCIPGALRLLT